MLNELDKELTSRGLPFVRYAEDSMIFCKSKRAAKRVKESVTRFIEGKLHLKVNRDKTVVSYVQGVKYLGYTFYVMKGKVDFYKVDIDKEPELAAVFGIQSIPTFLFIPQKGMPSAQMGMMEKGEIKDY